MQIEIPAECTSSLADAMYYCLLATPRSRDRYSRESCRQLIFEQRYVAATDGHRLHGARIGVRFPEQVCLGVKAARKVMRLLKRKQPRGLAVTAEQVDDYARRVVVEIPGADAITYDWTYQPPDIKAVIPLLASMSCRVEVRRSLLFDAVRVHRPAESVLVDMCSDRRPVVALLSDSAVTTIDTAICGPVGKACVQVNTRYLLDALPPPEKQSVILRTYSSSKVLHMQASGHDAYIMPIEE